MEAFFDQVFLLLSGFADKYQWLSYVMMVVGGIYLFLTIIRGMLTGLVKLTKTPKDDDIVLAVYAFLDKWAYGFGKLADYYEQKTDKK